MALENDRHFLHRKQKRAQTNFARRSIMEQSFFHGSVVLLIVSARLIRRQRFDSKNKISKSYLGRFAFSSR